MRSDKVEPWQLVAADIFGPLPSGEKSVCALSKAMRSAKVEPWRGVPWRSVITPFPVAYRQRGLSVP